MATPVLPDLSGKRDWNSGAPQRIKQPAFPANHAMISSLKNIKSAPMKLDLKLKVKPPKGAVIIEGFPGFGFVATIAVEYLLEHLKMHSIGYFWSPRLAPMAFIHNKRIIQPLEIFHNEKHNIVILEAVAGVNGMEWDVVDALQKLYKTIDAKEIISIEGVGTPIVRKDALAYYHTNNESSQKKFDAMGISAIKEGVIFGVTGAMMLKSGKDITSTAIFAETQSDLPDSKAASKIIQVLDSYLKLGIDYKPLLKRASEFEDRLRGIAGKTKEAAIIKSEKEKDMPYVG